ncbi:MAG: TIR domain-containing protein [Mycobacteriaceae bacterium]|nr:TIR domain-containing protein [Mycobacteriaceae bacterium]MBV9639256.1 TIR domain-containing protein [Mycobacteriaceae bacterium]
MPRIFLSHSSRDNRQAIGLRQWLIDQDPQLADEIFLDLNRDTGIRSGVRWKDALRQASARCEAVICLLSPNWEVSAECRTEFRFAEYLNKRIFSARIAALTGDDPTREWQQIDLFGDGPTTEVDIDDGRGPVIFLTEGLHRLRDGIAAAGIGAESFRWPPATDPRRAPYRGWEPLQDVDAAVFFGRDAQMLRGLDALRGMRRSGLETMFVVLGPSGTGKSSFLRAGLLPRLRRDDREFLLLDIVRPQRRVLTGDTGLAHALHTTRVSLRLQSPNLAQVKAACAGGDAERVRTWLLEAQRAACERLLDRAANAQAPTLVLPIDQAEELFGADAGSEASVFLRLIADLAKANDGRVALGFIAAVTIRTDRYQALQTAPELTGMGSVLFDELKPMPRTQFKEVITGPAARATEGGHALEIEPTLVNTLLDDCTEGGDTLPLLALTLARLYEDYASDGGLDLSDYQSMGGMRSVVRTEIDGLLAANAEQRAAQLKLLRTAFIPWLATVNPDNDQPMRRVARWNDLPAESWPLLEKFVTKRLLMKDTRDGYVVVEVALESLLRQWDDLARWLADEREDLKDADNVERAARAWQQSQQNDAWLLEGTRLTDAETLAAKPGFRDRLQPAREFLNASRRREQERVEAEARHQAAELQAAKDRQQAAEALAAAEAEAREKAQAHAAVLRRRSHVLRAVLAVTLVIATAAVAGFVMATKATDRADQRTLDALRLRLTSQGQAMLAGVEGGGDVRAFQEILAAHRIDPIHLSSLLTAVVTRVDTTRVIEAGGPIMDVSVSPDGHHIISGGADDTVRVWDINTGEPVGPPMTGQAGRVNNVALSDDGRHVLFGGADNTLRVWDADTGKPVGPPMPGVSDVMDLSDDGHRVVSGGSDGTVRVWNADTAQPISAPMAGNTNNVSSVAFSNDGQRVVTGSTTGVVRVWDADSGQPISPEIAGHSGAVTAVTFNSDGHRAASGGADHVVRMWNADTGQPIAGPMIGHLNTVTSVDFSPDDGRVLSGSYDGTLRLWDASTGQAIGQPMSGHQGAVNGVAFTPDGHGIVSGGDDATLRLWDADMGSPTDASLPTGPSMVTSATVSMDRHRIASGDKDGILRFWNADTLAAIGPAMNGHHGAITSVALSADNHRLVSGSADGTLQLWNTDTLAPIGPPMTGHRGAATSAVFSLDGRRMISGGADDTVRIWDADSGKPVGGPMTGHTGAVSAVDISNDGHRIVSGSTDTTLRLWDAASGQPIGSPMTGHTGAVLNVQFGPDGQRVISRSADTTMRLWDATGVRPLGGPMNGHALGTLPIAVSFAPDGQSITSVDSDPTRRLWPKPAQWMWPSLVCSKLSQNMSHKQWRDWVAPDVGYIEVCPGLPIPPDNRNQ